MWNKGLTSWAKPKEINDVEGPETVNEHMVEIRCFKEGDTSLNDKDQRDLFLNEIGPFLKYLNNSQARVPTYCRQNLVLQKASSIEIFISLTL